ncbi:MAG: signal peptidase I [Clostridiales bacterium]|nr:signal peptidase I [Clostridiales bacterium]
MIFDKEALGAGVSHLLKAGKIMLSILLLLLIAANVYVIGARMITGDPLPTMLGWSWAVIGSGSMEPEIKVYDMVVVHEQDDYEVGDVIAFHSGDISITHRIIDIDGDSFITKGDSNQMHDRSPVPYLDVIGEVVLVIPKIGLLVEYLKTPVGIACMAIIGIILAIKPFVVYTDSMGGKNEHENI